MFSTQKLSNQELESHLKNLVHQERKLLHLILEHINELDTRKLYLERAYSSLYEYLTKELGYSGSAAMRRIEAARLLREVPVVAEKIQAGSLNLSQIGEVSLSIKEKERTTGIKITGLQKEVLLAKITGKTTLETQKELAVVLDIPVKDFEKQKMQKDESVRLELTLSKEQYQKILDCRDSAAHLLEQNQSDFSWASVFEVLADQYLAKKSPEKSLKGTSEKITRTVGDAKIKIEVPHVGTKTETSTSIETKSRSKSKSKSETESTTKSVPRSVNKTLTMKTRKIVLERDACCQYQDAQTGRQCGSTFGLQVDHKTSQWAGGSHQIENLQVLCGKHNRLKYQKEVNLKLGDRTLIRGKSNYFRKTEGCSIYFERIKELSAIPS